MILGMEWLETFSPMWVDWRRKKLRFTYHNQRLTFIGVKDQINSGKLIIAKQMQGLYKDGAISQIVQLCQAEVPAHAGQTYPAEIDQVIPEFKERFDEPQGLPPHRQFDHNIPLLPNAKPVTKKPYRYSPQQKNEIEKQVTQMLQQGIIQSNVSPFASPVLLVKKKDGTWRFCVDYRGLNEITVKNKYPMPVVEELLDELADAQWFTKLDLRSGYHQIRLVEQDEAKTAFRTHQGHYEFKVMPFGLTNAPATFQGLMNTIFSAVIRKFVLVFVDDILIYSKSLEEHVDHLRTVFQLLQQHGLFVKASKCSFAQQHLDYLGHVIGIHGVSTDPEKVMAVQHWPIPKNLKQLRGFLGLAGYYRKFIKGYGILTKPLTELLKKDVKYKWEQQEQTAFDAVKMALTQSPVLALPDFSKQFVVETDASDKGIGAVLMQQGHPIAFISKALGVKSQMLSTYEKEFMAILLAVNKWRSYLQHAEFVIQTDHKSLTHLNEQQLGTSMQQKAFVKLMGLQYVIKYKKGAENQVADALSRRGEEECVAITVSTPRWMELVVEEYHNHPQTKQLLASLCLNPEGEDGFQLVNGVIQFHGKIWLGHHPEAQQSVLLALHNSGVGGHSGITATYHRIKGLFAWPGLRKVVQTYVFQCEICQQAKVEHCKTPGLLQPLPVPLQAWHTVTMDFVEGLPKSGGYDTIMVVVDKFSKFAKFIPLTHPFTAYTVALAFIQHVYDVFGMPQVIISDRDRIFTSALWQELFRLADVKLNMSSSYHPQTDGQTERLNQCLEAFLRCTVHATPSKWSGWLSQAQHWYNTSFHSVLGKSPYEVLFARKPTHFGLVDTGSITVPDVQIWLQEHAQMNEVLHQQLTRAQQRMKHQVDKRRSERQFAVGDSVYLKLQPFA